MAYATVSEKYQIVIPKEIREAISLKVKEKLLIWCEDGRIEMLPIQKIKDPVKVLASITKKKFKIKIKKLEAEIEKGLE